MAQGRKLTLTLGIVIGVGGVLALAGCTRAAGPAQTVSYLRAHPTILRAVWARCANDPGGLGRTPECVNARRAEAVQQIGSFRTLAPMPFPSRPGSRQRSAPTSAPSSPPRR